MKAFSIGKSLFWHCVLCCFFGSIPSLISAQSNNLYEYNPKEEVIKLFVKACNSKSPEKMEELLLKTISIDENFSYPYHILGDLKVQERLVFEDKGAYYYYSKFLEKQTKYNCSRSSISDFTWDLIHNSSKGDLFGHCTSGPAKDSMLIESKKFVTQKRFESVWNGLIWADKRVTTPMAEKLSIVIQDIYSLTEEYQCGELNPDIASNLCIVTGDYFMQQGNYSMALEAYQKFETFKFKLSYNQIDNFTNIFGNRISLAFALNGQKELARQNLNLTLKSLPSYGVIDKNIMAGVIKVVNILDKLQPGESIKNSRGEMVYVENKNIRVDNFSSAFQLCSAFRGLDLRRVNDEIYKGGYHKFSPTNYSITSSDITSSDYQGLIEWTALGSQLGTIWPKPRPISPNELVKNGLETMVPSYLRNFIFKCDCATDIFDIRLTSNGYDIYRASRKYPSLIGVMSVPLDWRQFNNMTVKYYNKNGELILKDSLGNNLPTSGKCTKGYEMYKAEYEAMLARQEAERIEQERLRIAQEQARIQQENETKLQLAIAEAEAKKATQQQEQKTVQAQTKAAVEQGKVVDPFAYAESLFSLFGSSGSSSKNMIQCPDCKGSGTGAMCSKCRGKGSYMCDLCKGTGKDFDRSCSRCLTRGTINCQQCKATGVDYCGRCHGSGKIEK
jgi:hypothetical protein